MRIGKYESSDGTTGRHQLSSDWTGVGAARLLLAPRLGGNCEKTAPVL